MRAFALRTGPLLLLLLVLNSALACSSTGKGSGPKRGKPEPFVPLPDEGPETITYFLTRFDRSLLQWSGLKLAGSSPREQNELAALEASMTYRAQKRRDELLTELESGAPNNRRVAAAALGFTHDPTVLGPLSATLSDRDPEVVQKALLALGVLAHPDTPLGPLHSLLVNAPEPWTRNNAAFTLLALARAGCRTSEMAQTCRAGLGDSEAGVRAQCASALGAMADPEAAPQLAALLMDGQNLVALAAAMALANLGREHPEMKGTAARALSGALDGVQADRRQHFLGALRLLADENMGDDARPWREWAYKLP
ncbi:MAG: HEAT repeat domain-containing protein [Planctomycetes bacterium]|nr:HEAT repeat domain-containing protein [Planctomycetota bacterium]